MDQVDMGRIRGADEKFCQSCGIIADSIADVCPGCGTRQKKGINKVVLLLVTFFMGGIGLHKFYVKKNGLGLVYLLFFWTCIPGLIALIEFFIFAFTDSDELKRKYPESASVGLILILISAGIIFIMLAGMMLTVAVPNFMVYRAKKYDALANKDISNAYKAAQAYFADNPAATITKSKLNQAGYHPSEEVTLTIENGKMKTLKMTAVHKKGKRIYSVNWQGKIVVKSAKQI